MIYRDVSTNCPRCAVPLERFRVIGLSYRLCPKCSGAWVGFAELEEMFDFMDPHADPLLQGLGVSRLPCPSCRAPMKQAVVSAGRDAPTGRRPWAALEAPRPAETSITLRVEVPGQAIDELVVNSDIIKLGRLPSCQVVLDHPSVSRLHAVIGLGAPPTIVDLGSATGIRINGQRLARSSLAADDLIELGDVAIVVVAAPSAPAGQGTPSTTVGSAGTASALRVEIDVCESHGLWFDRDELARALFCASAGVEPQ